MHLNNYPPKTVLVLGDGLAAHLVGCALRQRGKTVMLLGRGKQMVRHHSSHGHSLNIATIEGLSALAGGHLKGYEVAETIGINMNGGLEQLAPRPVVDCLALTQSIKSWAQSHGVQLLNDGIFVPHPSDDGRTWVVQDYQAKLTRRADLLIDASGATRALALILAQLTGAKLFVDEGGPPSFYLTLHGTGVSGQRPATLVLDAVPIDVGQVCAGMVALHRSGQTSVTLKSEVPFGAEQSKVPLELDKLIPSPWRGSITWSHVPMVYTSFGARRLALDEANLTGLPPCLAIGDALLQTPPSQGQGIAQIVSQVRMLGVLLDNRETFDAIGARLCAGAHAAWLASSMKAMSRVQVTSLNKIHTPCPVFSS
jgi:hypothetical protein